MRAEINAMLFIQIFINVELKHATNSPKYCQCVPTYLCQDDSDDDLDIGTIIMESINGLTERDETDCYSPLDICCKSEKILGSNKSLPQGNEDTTTPSSTLASTRSTTLLSILSGSRSTLLSTLLSTRSTPGCGFRNFDGIESRTKSSNYHETLFGEFPWVVAVLHNKRDKQDEYICDGALIHQKVVLTAAHCVYGKAVKSLKIRAGEWNTQQTDESMPHQDRTIDDILIDENYKSGLFDNNFALLILQRPVKITTNVNVICLPQSIDELEITRCVVTGWGRNRSGSHEKILKKMELQISSGNCQESSRQSRALVDPSPDKSFFCAGDTLEHNPWKGDGGSPFVCPLKNDVHRFAQIGVSIQYMGRTTWTPNVFANVLHARTWIDEQLMFHNLDNTEYRYNQQFAEDD